ncbi:RidA family protein [Bradyrhizobium shewense]|uniref:RidA family protein n=1 Tax=Bradyrhizobium shewense TaxID=1761772 RepID=UPI000AAD8BC1|nr:RidA family protein [Bradyrhizobium shewense]
MSRRVHSPTGIFDSLHYGFGQVVVIPTPFGDTVHVSGQVAWDAGRKVVGAGDIGRQLRKSLENLAVALASVGAKLDQVGALRLYIKQSQFARGRGHQWRTQSNVR